MSSEMKRRILLIDDDTSLLTTLSDFLSFEGYDVTTADSGEQGLKRLKGLSPDLIILDMSMPGMGGIGFLKKISDSTGKPSHPVLVLTARANMAEFFSNVDVDGFVAKPCDPNDLLMEVARIIFLRSGESTGSETTSGMVRNLKILLGEDDPLVKSRLLNTLEDEGFQVVQVERGPELMEQAIVVRPDIVVLKQILPGMNGDKVAEMLRIMPNTQNIPIVIYDGSGSGRQPLGTTDKTVHVVATDETDDILAAVKQFAGN